MNAAPPPHVSVVIPTHNRLPVLRQCLAALAAQRYPVDRMEVIVVADGCTDGTEAVLAEASLPFTLNVLSQKAGGSGAARNHGAETAQGSILLFLDDDVIASPELVQVHARVHAQEGECAVIGPYLPDWPKEQSYLAAVLYQFWHDTFEAMEDPKRRHVLSGNLSVPAATFARSGGFNPILIGALEDYEFGLRLEQQGVKLVYATEASASHLETSDLAASLRRIRNGGRASVIMTGLHPHLLPTSRLLRADVFAKQLVFGAPRLGSLVARSLIPLLEGLERLRLRRLWTLTYGRLRAYWFWRGVADEVGSGSGWEAELARLKRAYEMQTSSMPSTGDPLAAAPGAGSSA